MTPATTFPVVMEPVVGPFLTEITSVIVPPDIMDDIANKLLTLVTDPPVLMGAVVRSWKKGGLGEF